MTASKGTRLGPYQLEGLLGTGGMGEVYRARDTTLNRDVAIKVLLPAVTTDPERLSRFSREGWLANRSSGQYMNMPSVALPEHFKATVWWVTFAYTPERRLVDQTSASWNQVIIWLHNIEVLRTAA
jgi:serine/threonine protein kinase